MKKYLTISLLSMAMASTAMANNKVDEEGIYGSLFVGYSSLSSTNFKESGLSLKAKFDNAPHVGASIGYEYANDVRGELEISTVSHDFDSFGGIEVEGEAEAVNYMVNTYYDYETSLPLTPYLGVGIGISEVKTDLSYAGLSTNADDVVFAYQGILGASYKVTDNVSISSEYRHFRTKELDLDGAKASYKNNAVLFKISRSF